MKIKKSLLVGALVLSSYTSSYAIFGFGDIVHDPLNYVTAGQNLNEQIKQYSEMARQGNNQIKQLEEAYQTTQHLKNQIESWKYMKFRNMTDVAKNMREAMRAGNSLHRGSGEIASLVDGMAGTNMSDSAYFDTLKGSLSMLDEQQKLFEADARGYDDLLHRMNGDVKGGTSAIGALANMNEALLNHVDDLNAKLEAQLVNESAKAIKEQNEKAIAGEKRDNIANQIANAKLNDDGKWDWTKFKPVYTSNKQEAVR